MGIVVKAYEERLERTVALTLLRPEQMSDRTALGGFEREVNADTPASDGFPDPHSSLT